MDTEEMRDHLALHLDIPLDDVIEESWEHYGLTVFSVPGQEWAIGDDFEADQAAEEHIKENLWAFSSEFISSYTDLPARGIAVVQDALNEDANDFIEALIEHAGSVEDFASDAVSADGRGHMLASYDNEEVEIDADGETLYAYRVN